MKLAPIDTAFEGFRIIRDRPGLILAWAAFYLPLFLVIIAVMLAAHWIQPASQGGAPALGEDQFDYLIRRFGLALLVIIPIACAMVSVVPAAITRSVVRPDDGKGAYIRLGADELRLLLLQVVLPLFIVVVTASYDWFVQRVFDFSGPLRWLVPGLAVTTSFVLWAWLYLRLCLLVAATVASRRFSVLEAWRVTRGHLFSLCVMWLIVLACIVGVTFLCVGASFLIASVTGGFRVFGEISRSDTTGISQGAAIRALLELLIQLATGALWLVLCCTFVYAAAARAYLTFKGAVVQDEP